MEKVSYNSRKYKNYRFDKNNHNSLKEGNENEFSLINKDSKDIYESQITKKYTNIIKKENSNKFQPDKNFLSKGKDSILNNNKNNRHLVYNSINQNCFDNNDNKYIENNNNRRNVYRAQVGSNNKSPNNVNPGKDNNSNNNNKPINKNNSNNFSNLAKTLKYFNNKISFNNKNNNFFYDIYYDTNSGKKLKANKNISKNDYSSDKISLNLEDKNLYNLLKNANFRNFDIQTNYNQKKIKTIIGSVGSKNNSIWSNINKELLPKEIDLQNNILNDEEENKSKTPLKINERYKNGLKSSTNEKNVLGDKKNGLDYRTKESLNQNEWKPNMKKKEVKKDNEDDKENKDLISTKMKIKDINDNKQFNQENSDRNTLKKYNSINNTNLKKSFDANNSKKKYANQTNKIMINKGQNQTKNYPTNNFLNKNSKFTKSSPNILKQFQPFNIKNMNFKSPISYKEVSIFNSILSKSGNFGGRNNVSLECSFENYPSLKNLNNIHVNLINQSSPKKNNKKSVPKTSINLNGNRNKLIKQNEKKKEANDTNANQNKNQNQNTLLNKNQLKPILSQNDIKNSLKKTKSNNNTETNNTKIIISDNNNINNNKNQFYMKQNSKIIFQKKVNRSPMGFNKKLNTHKSSNNELSENTGSILKITDNSSSNLKKSMNENRFKIDKNIYNYNFVNNNNNNVSQDIERINKVKNIKINNSIDSYKNTNASSGINKKIYIKQKAQKKLDQPKYITQGKLDTKKINQMKFEEKYNNDFSEKKDLYNNDYIDYYPMENIKNKINIKKKNLTTKYYDYFINYPKLEKCSYSKTFFKIMKIPEIEICHISKINLPFCKIYKSNSVCYFTKIRVIGKQIASPPVNNNCEISKNIILNIPKHKDEKIKKETEIGKLNNQKSELPKKNKKRKKRRKTRALLKGKENNKNENKNNDKDNELDNNIDDNENDNDIENDDNKIIEREEPNEEKEKNLNMKKEIKINNISNGNSPYLEGNKKNSRKIIINNRSPKYKSSNDEKSGVISEREVVFTDIEKNCSLKSPTIYNDDDFNDEENDDFRIESDEDEEISSDKYKRKDIDKEYKTEGKEITVDYNKNKMTKEQKTTKGFKILEKLQGKRNSVEYDNLNNLYFKKEMGEYNDNENMYTDDDYNYEGNNKKIALATNKLNEIFNNQKNHVYNNDEDNEEIENEDNNENYSNDYIENNNAHNGKDINYNIYRKKNNTYKKKLNYERIGTIFDRLEGIIDKKKTNKKFSIIDINSENVENEKCKTPLMKMGDNIKNRINEFKFDLKEDNNCYIYNDDNNNENNENDENENYYNNTDNNNNNENKNEEDSEERKDNYLKKDMDMNKYKEIFNKQQIISKLESLMNKPKKENNINFDENIFNSPKIESEVDTDMNANKDTPGNRKEIKKNFLLQCQKRIINKRMYTFEEIISYKNKKLCLNNNLLSLEVIKHCHEISNNIEHKDSFKANYKDIVMNSNNYVYNRRNSSNILEKKEKESSMSQWARKDMTKEIEEAEKYVKELNSKMSKDNYKHKIIEVLNTLTVDNYKNILNKMIEMLYLSENPRNNKVELNKPEYLLHNQFIFVEIILDKATIEKGYVVLYAKLCADLFIELIKLIKQYNNPQIGNQLINGENLKTILTNQCRQRFDECISISSLSENANDYDKKEIFLTFKKKFLGNMDFISELINVKILSQTKGFEFLDILYKRYKEIKNNDKIKFLNLEGAVTLLTKFGRIIMDRKNPKHVQNLDNYINDNLYPIISNNKSKNNDNKGLPNYLKFKIINLIEKKKNNWKDSLYEQSIVAKGKNNNISISHDLTDSNINIDESLLDNQKVMNNTCKEKEEDRIIILLKNDIENYVSFLSEHNVTNKQELNDYNNQNENSDINNEYDWTISEELIIKTKNELEEIIRCYIEVCIDYVTKEKNIFFCNEYIKNIVNYYSLDLTKDEIEKIQLSMNDLYLNIEDICIDNYFMLEVMGYLLLILLNNNLFYIEDLNKFISEDKERIIKISQVIKFTIAHSEDKYKDLYHNFRKIKLYNDNEDIFEEYIEKPLQNNYEMNFE